MHVERSQLNYPIRQVETKPRNKKQWKVPIARVFLLVKTPLHKSTSLCNMEWITRTLIVVNNKNTDCCEQIKLIFPSIHLLLTLKAPRKILEQKTVCFCFLFFRENNAWHYMWIVCQADDSHVMSSIISSEKCEKHALKCRLPVVIGALRVLEVIFRYLVK